jgi:hypothetical protein
MAMTAPSSALVRAAIAGVAIALLAATPAQSQTPAPGASGVEQYRELVPGAGGPSAPGLAPSDQSQLPQAAQDALQQVPPGVATPLEKIATSADYGAPVDAPAPETSPPEGGTVSTETSVDAALASAVAAVGSASDARVVGLLVVVFVTTIAAFSLAFTRRRGQASAL